MKRIVNANCVAWKKCRVKLINLSAKNLEVLSSWVEKERADPEWTEELKRRNDFRISDVFLRDYNCKNKVPRTPTCLSLDDER